MSEPSITRAWMQLDPHSKAQVTECAHQGQPHPDPAVAAVATDYAQWLLAHEPKSHIAKMLAGFAMTVRLVGIPQERYEWARLVLSTRTSDQTS